MRLILSILLTIFFLNSCQENNQKETKSEAEITITQSEFRKIETNNSLKLEYQLLDENDEIIEFTKLRKMAEFPGGYDSLETFIQENFIFPESTENIKVKGRVETTFSVDTLGKVVEIQVIDGLMEEIDQSCIEVISKMPDWKPAEISENEKVKMRFGLPLKFVPKDENE